MGGRKSWTDESLRKDAGNRAEALKSGSTPTQYMQNADAKKEAQLTAFDLLLLYYRSPLHLGCNPPSVKTSP